MARVVAITSGEYLSASGGLLRLRQPGIERTLPLADVGALLIDAPALVVSAAALGQLGRGGVPVVLADAGHAPALMLLPVTHQQAARRRQLAQAHLSRERAWGAWRAILDAKLAMQAALLALRGQGADAHRIDRLRNRIGAGNAEAMAARAYWRALLPDMPGRVKPGAGDAQNAALNYGYAVLRALVARHVVAAGLNPLFGMAHTNAKNPLPLVDDLIEPFRVAVDAQVAAGLPDGEGMTPARKAHVLGLLEVSFRIGGETCNVQRAVEIAVAGYARYVEGKRKALVLPKAIRLPVPDSGR